MHNNKVNLFFTDNTIQSAQFFPHPFISCTMKEKYCGSQKGVNRRKSRIQRHILIVFRQESKDETGKYQRSDNQIGPLHDFGRQPLSLVQAGNSTVVFRTRSLNDGEGENHNDGYYNDLTVNQWFVDLEPTMVGAPVVIVHQANRH